MNNRQQIIDNIISIEDEKEIVIDMLKLEFSTNKYSAKKNSIWHLILNNKNQSCNKGKRFQAQSSLRIEF